VRPGGCVYLALTSANFLQQSPTLDLVQLQGTGSIGAAAAAFAWHSHTGVINGAASVVRVDGAETTGTVAVVAGTGLMYFAAAAAGATCQQSEMVWWDGYALTQSERAALSNNQRAFWGF